MAVLAWRRRRLSRLGRRLVAGLIAAAACVGVARAAEPPSPSLEYAVKASYLYKFAPFVVWPPQAFATPASPLNICVAGDDPFGSILDDITHGQDWQGHPIAIRRMPTVETGAECHILFIGHSPSQSAAQMLKAVDGQPVLTVTDQGRAGAGSIIQFVIRDGRVRFDIDQIAAQASGMTISSKLLDLAVTVRRR